MKGKRFKEEQIIRILHEAEGGLTVAEVCRKHNCSEQSFLSLEIEIRRWTSQDTHHN